MPGEAAHAADLLHALKAAGYAFITPTPATHQRVIARKSLARDLRDVFGWNLPFADGLLPNDLMDILRQGDLIEKGRDGLKSRLRVAGLDGLLFAHSGFPTDSADAVFFGPDSYRFATFITRHAPRLPGLDIIDLGAGAGVGGLVAARLSPGSRVTLMDINPAALALAQANAQAAEIEVECRHQAGLDGAPRVDLIVANPPYMLDDASRLYRDGGGDQGEAVTLAWATQALGHLRPGGRLILYSGSAIRGGHDAILAGLRALPAELTHYEEIDPDVFGEELDKPAYAGIERIAAIGAVLVQPG
ncbi:MAG: class SAM-dependent methyltransferase [Caulobacteraceae bacterium]|nr:class SAM-dependent methyltransferase [Caulobacteraceae bacterium]